MNIPSLLESDFAFPHDYVVEEFGELPGTGTLNVPLIYFPPPKGRPEHNGEWLKVKAKSGMRIFTIFHPGIFNIIHPPPGFAFRFLAVSLLHGNDQQSVRMERTVVGPRGNCGKRFLLSKPLWESAVCADFRQRRQFPQAFRFFLEKISFR